MGEERRRFKRIPLSFEVRCRPVGEFSELWRAVRALDISASGIQVRGEEPFEFWTKMDIRLLIPGLREPLELHGRVVWNKTLPSGMTEAGMEFVDVSPEQQKQLDELLLFFKDKK